MWGETGSLATFVQNIKKKGDEKMNEFYHDFVVGFNWWYVMLPLAMFLMVIIGMSRFALNRKTLKIMRKRENRFFLTLMAGALDLMLCALILKESFVGLLQVIANNLGDSDIAWIPVLAALAILAMVFVCYYALYACGRLGMKIAYRYLKALRSELITMNELKMARSVAKKHHNEKATMVTLNPADYPERMNPEDVEVIPPSYEYSYN